VGYNEESWRGGYLLSALELYLKISMRAKFQFLNEIEAAVSFTGTLMTQNNWGSATSDDTTTTMVPEVDVDFFFKIIQDPSLAGACGGARGEEEEEEGVR
jgi:hypothetical protein